MAADGFVFSSGGQLLNGQSQSPGQIQLPSQQKAAQPAAKTGGNTGLLAEIYNHTLGPIVNSVEGGISDIPNIAASAAYLPRMATALATNNVKAQNSLDAAQNQRLASTNFVKNFTSGQNAQTGAIGGNLEQGLGKSTDQVLNLTSPITGAETLGGRTGLNAIGAGIGVGAKLGAAGGIGNAAAQGGNGEQLFAGGVTGGLEGAAAGGLGGGLQSLAGSNLARSLTSGTGKLARGVGQGITGRSADVAGAGADATVGAPGGGPPPSSGGSGGLFNRAATNAGAKAAQNEMGQNAIDFAGANKGDIAGAMSHDANGNPVGMTQVRSFLRGNGMDDTAANMDVLNSTSGPIQGGLLQDMTQGITLDASGAKQAGLDMAQAKLTGSYGNQTTRIINDATSNLDKLGTNATVPDVLSSISKLEDAKNIAKQAASSNEPAGHAANAYQTVIDNLHAKLDSSSVNNAIASYKVPPDLEQTIQQDVQSNGGSPQLAQNYIDTANNATNYRQMQSGMQMGQVAGNLSKVAKDNFANAVPQVDKSTGRPQLPSWELAMSLHNPSYLAAGAARLAQNAGIAGRVLSKVNPGAFAAGREAALAPDPLTAQKLASPGATGASAPTYTPSNAENMGLPTGPEPLLTNQTTPGTSGGPAPTPTTPGIATPAEQTAQVPTSTPEEQGAPVVGPPTTTPTSNLDNSLQQIGVRPTGAQAPETGALGPGSQPGPVVNGISGPIPNSGGALGAESQPAVPVPTQPMQTTTVPVIGEQASGSVPVATTPPAPTNVPVTGSQASGEVPVTTPPPSPLQPALNGVSNVANAVGRGVNAVDNAVRAIPGRVAGVAEATPNITGAVSRLPDQIKAGIGSAKSAVKSTNASGVISALTGETANQLGQGAGSLPTSGGAASPATGATGAPTKFVSSYTGQPTLDINSIPGGTLADYTAEVTADPKNEAIYKAIYDAAQAQVKASIPKAPTAAQSTGATSIQDAASYLDTIESQLAAVGGVNAQAGYEAQIPLVGKYLQPGITAYNETKVDAATALAKALTGRAATQSSVAMFMKSLPSAVDSPAQAADKIANLRQELAGKAPDYGLVPAGG